MVSEKQRIKILEQKTGHIFTDYDRLQRALTHASARPSSSSNYERLEFLGDRVLGLVVAQMLFADFPDADEGELSVRLNSLVSAEACASVADEIGLGDLIYTGADIKSLNDKRLLNVRADVIEALIATIYLDGGLEAAQQFIQRYWEPRSRETGAGRRDAKTELQEWAHQQGPQGKLQPVYTIQSRTGPDHEPVFIIKVAIAGFEPAAGAGRSKRIAEQDAAETFLYRQGIWKRQEEKVK